MYDAENGNVVELGYYNIFDLEEVLKYVVCNYEAVIAKNIDTSYCSVVEMLSSVGFEQIASQFEMVKELPVYAIIE